MESFAKTEALRWSDTGSDLSEWSSFSLKLIGTMMGDSSRGKTRKGDNMRKIHFN